MQGALSFASFESILRIDRLQLFVANKKQSAQLLSPQVARQRRRRRAASYKSILPESLKDIRVSRLNAVVIETLLTLKKVAPINRTVLAHVSTVIALLCVSGCASLPKGLIVTGIPEPFPPGTILSSDARSPIDIDGLIKNLADVRIVYIGEQHTDAAHHDIQLKIITALCRENPNLSIGMEMFDHTYQPVLDQWSAGELSEEAFQQKTHWYANWRYEYTLYKPILDFIREKGIRLVGLNMPFHLSGKIATGGIESLSDDDRKHLAANIDTTKTAHRDYVKNIFDRHKIRGRENFDYFYEAQCAWEDSMAERVAENLNDSLFIVLIGNGHIFRKFGVPDRAFSRTGTPFKTVYPARAGDTVEVSSADYIWVTPGKSH